MVSWLPLNLLMVPILLLSMRIGQSHNDIFKITDISDKEVILSKIATMFIIKGVILFFNIILLVALGLICKVSIGYFLYQSIGYITQILLGYDKGEEGKLKNLEK